MLNNNPLCQLYVGELNSSVNEEVLFGAFSRFGRILSMKVMRHIVTGASRGFAFINYSTPNEASRAKSAMNGTKFFDKNLKIFLKTEYDVLDQNANIVVQGLSENITESELLSLISPLAKPFSIKIVKNDKRPGESKAYLQFETLEQSRTVIEKLNGMKIDSKELSAELTNRKNKVFIKAKHSDKALNELKQSLDGWKVEEIEAPEVSTDKTHFIVLVKFESEAIANSFLEEVSKNPSKFPLIVKAVDKANLKSLKVDFQSESSGFYCRISSLKNPADFEKLRSELVNKHEQATSVKLNELQDGINEVEINFANSKSLADFILKIQKKDSPFLDYFHGDNLKVDFPHFMIAVLRKVKMAMKKNTVKAWEGHKNINVHQPWPQGQFPFQQGQPGMTPQAFPFPTGQTPKLQLEFNSHSDILKDKEHYSSLSAERKTEILNRLLHAKLRNFPKLIDMKNTETVKKVCDVFLDSEVIDQMELIENLGNDEEFENLLKQAIDY